MEEEKFVSDLRTIGQITQTVEDTEINPTTEHFKQCSAFAAGEFWTIFIGLTIFFRFPNINITFSLIPYFKNNLDLIIFIFVLIFIFAMNVNTGKRVNIILTMWL